MRRRDSCRGVNLHDRYFTPTETRTACCYIAYMATRTVNDPPINNQRRHATTPFLNLIVNARWRRILSAVLIGTVSIPPSSAETVDDESVRLYRTRAEKREAGLHRQLTPWLTLSGLVELDWNKDRFAVAGNTDGIRQQDEAMTVQLGLIATPLESVNTELILEYDTDTDRVKTEEFTFALESDSWEFAAGKQYLPLGEYFSRFVTGPLIEFGETRDTAATLSYDFRDRLGLSMSVYHGAAGELDRNNRGLDWTFAMEAWPQRNLALGLSYQTDLADADSRLLADHDNRFVRKVPVLSGYVLWVKEHFELTFEALGATRPFIEFDADRDQPRAWNLELALFPHRQLDLALRIEGSRELEDEPHLQYGAAVTFLLHRYATLTLEYLHGRFHDDLATDDDGNPLDDVDRVGAQLSIAF